MADNTGFVRMGGGVRLRTCLPGYDPENPALDERVLTYDSTWPNALRVLHNGISYGGSLGGRAITYGTVGVPGARNGARQVKVLPFAGANGPFRPTLAWMRNGGGTLNFVAAGTSLSGPGETKTYARGYGVCAVNLRNDEILFSPARNEVDYVYYIFGTNPTAAEGAGGNSIVLGKHPLYGPGIYVSRPGFDAETCALDDMVLTSRRNHFQVAETGIAYPSTYSGGGALAPNDLASGDPFPLAGVAPVRTAAIVNLRGSYPHYPPVMAFAVDVGLGGEPRHQCSIFWLSPSQLLLTSSAGGGSGIKFAVVGGDPTYQFGVDTIPGLDRVWWAKGDGLYVVKHDVTYGSAGPNDFLYRSDRQSPRFSGFGTIATAAPSNFYDLPAPAPLGAGPPFAFMIVSDNLDYSGWWCGMGQVMMQDIADSNPSVNGPYYGPFFYGSVYDRSRYRWYRNAAFPASYFGYVSTINISDF